MNKNGRFAVPILFVLIVVVLVLAGGVFYLFQKEHARNLSLQVELDNTLAKYRKAEAELEASKKEILSFNLQLKEAKSKIDALNSELQQEKTAKSEAVAKIDQLELDLEQQRSLRLDLEKKLTQVQEDARKTQTYIKELEAKKTELESKIKDLETKAQGVELGKIVVSPETATFSETTTGLVQPISEKQEENTRVGGRQGKVLVLNKEYNFVVINLGNKDGIDLGDVFSVYHNNEYIGDIEVEKIHDTMAAAGFVTEKIKDKISEGDKVVQKVK